jgi:hypothetical protein
MACMDVLVNSRFTENPSTWFWLISSFHDGGVNLEFIGNILIVHSLSTIIHLYPCNQVGWEYEEDGQGKKYIVQIWFVVRFERKAVDSKQCISYEAE